MRRGISPIIATILLIIMTVGIAALVYTWMSGMLAQLTTQASQQILQQTSFNFAVNGIMFNNTSAVFVVAITNTGSVKINFSSTDVITAVTAYNKLQPGTPLQTVTCSMANNTIDLSPGQTKVYYINCNNLNTAYRDITQYYYVLSIAMGGLTQQVTFS